VVVASVNHRGDKERGAVEPRQRVQLFPEARDHDRHVEAEDERHRDEVAVRLAVSTHQLEPSTDSREHHKLRAWPTLGDKTEKVHETITFLLVTLPNIHRFQKNLFTRGLSN